MKFVIFLTSLLAVVASKPTVKTWTLNELSNVIEKNESDPEMRKYYIDALNTIMYSLFTGDENSVQTKLKSPSGHLKWTLDELRTTLADPNLNKAVQPFIERAYHYIIQSNGAEKEVEVQVAALDISTWSAHDVSDALNNTDTNATLKIYLEKAAKEIEEGHKKSVTIITSVGLVPQTNQAQPIFATRTSFKVLPIIQYSSPISADD